MVFAFPLWIRSNFFYVRAFTPSKRMARAARRPQQFHRSNFHRAQKSVTSQSNRVATLRHPSQMREAMIERWPRTRSAAAGSFKEFFKENVPR